MAIMDKTLTLITGANSGIGLELARQLLAKGNYHILLCSRTPEKGEAAVKALKSRDYPGSVEFIHLDVTDDTTINRAAEYVERTYGKLDMLVNNAAIGTSDTLPLREDMQLAFDTNATGPLMVATALGPLLRKSTNPMRRIISVTSGAGSIGSRIAVSDHPSYKLKLYSYRTSKAAMNMITSCLWVEYGPDIKVFSYCPGYTESNLGSKNKIEFGAKPVADGVIPLVEILEGKRDDQAGGYLNDKRENYPW